jgi:hypothetical protein
MKPLKKVGVILFAVIAILAAVIEGGARMIAGSAAVLRVVMHRKYEYRHWLKRDLADCTSILELGCGAKSPLLQIGYGLKTDAIDIYLPYVEMHNRNHVYKSCRQANILDMELPYKSYDAVVICDVLEHLPKAAVDKIKLFEALEKCAIKKIILFTPNGYVDNDEVDGDPYQRHVSAWEPEDYEKRGYTVRGATAFRYITGKAAQPKYRPYSLFTIMMMLSQPYIFNNPKLAWHSYAVKSLVSEQRSDTIHLK